MQVGKGTKVGRLEGTEMGGKGMGEEQKERIGRIKVFGTGKWPALHLLPSMPFCTKVLVCDIFQYIYTCTCTELLKCVSEFIDFGKEKRAVTGKSLTLHSTPLFNQLQPFLDFLLAPKLIYHLRKVSERLSVKIWGLNGLLSPLLVDSGVISAIDFYISLVNSIFPLKPSKQWLNLEWHCPNHNNTKPLQ